ncbi:S41 family peptidase [Neolewinella lacunae]|uniref:PDZ domain-containing protein n=1 Tax=Neolewinella lacunae TaxID=1517758 RepID=A0A923PIM5_9BACT|nr:S41 family peptidase [Neolewinella lacunae]MBC6994772.1 PDZ domain-containing protein [Neolewinella lacunae]MDN3634394.1 S41 family peptidase [Neolewinella lacunae]
MKMKKLCAYVLLFGSWGMLSAQDPQGPYEKMLTQAQLMEDYDVLYASLINYHPAPFHYTPEAEFRAFYESQREALPDSLTELKFHLVARHLIARVKCGHTFGKPSEAWYNSLKGQKILLPFEIKRAEGKIYIANTTDEDLPFSTNDELLSLDSIPIKDVLAEMAQFQERDGYTTALVEAETIRKFRTYFLFLCGIQREVLVGFKNQAGDVQETWVNNANSPLKAPVETALPGAFEVVYANDWSTYALDETQNLAYLKISSFSDRKAFKKYYAEVFEHLQQYPAAQLVLDLRNNSGGYFGNGNRLLSHLTPDPFEFNFNEPKRKVTKNKHVSMDFWNKLTRMAFSIKPSKHKIAGQKTHTFTYQPSKVLHTGKVNVITNGSTFSQAALVAAHLHEHGATFFGGETGGTESGANAMVYYDLVLPHSAIRVRIPRYQIVSNSSLGAFGYGVPVQHPLSAGLAPGEDQVLAETIRIISAGKQD